MTVPESYLFVSTLDGTMYAVKKQTGEIRWSLKEGGSESVTIELYLYLKCVQRMIIYRRKLEKFIGKNCFDVNHLQLRIGLVLVLQRWLLKSCSLISTYYTKFQGYKLSPNIIWVDMCAYIQESNVRVVPKNIITSQQRNVFSLISFNTTFRDCLSITGFVTFIICFCTAFNLLRRNDETNY